MASVNQLTGGGGTNASSFNTASISPGANRIVLVAVASVKASPNTPTISGAGMTWTQVASAIHGTSFRITLFRALSTSPGSGALAIDFAGQSQEKCEWSITEFFVIDPTGTNGANAVVQSATVDSPLNTSPVVSLSSFFNAANAAFGALFTNTDPVITVGSGFSELYNGAVSGNRLQTQWKNSNDTSVDWTISSANDSVGIAVELKTLLGGNFFGFL